MKVFHYEPSKRACRIVEYEGLLFFDAHVCGEAAKREMMMHPEDGLEAIAARTGFISDTQLVKKFTEVTGESPRKWCRGQK